MEIYPVYRTNHLLKLKPSKTLQAGIFPSIIPARLFLLTAEVYISMSKPAEAAACTQEASNLFPTSHNVLYMRGQIAELRGNMDEAKRWYEEALSINPTHVKSMQRLVRTRPELVVMETTLFAVQILRTANVLASACKET